MELPHWGADDVRIIGDLLIGRLLIELAARVAFRFGILAIEKGALEPGAAWVWNRGYQLADRMAGGRLPDQPWAPEEGRAAVPVVLTPPPPPPSPGFDQAAASSASASDPAKGRLQSPASEPSN